MQRNLVLGVSMLAALAARPGPRASIDRLAWLAGCWEWTGAEVRIDEQWMTPRGGTMLGMSRTVRGGRTVAYESLRIYERGDRLVFAARPSGQDAAEFLSSSVTDDAVSFENPGHDFPQRIGYRAAGDSLFARIEGSRDDPTRASDFRYARTECPGTVP